MEQFYLQYFSIVHHIVVVLPCIAPVFVQLLFLIYLIPSISYILDPFNRSSEED